MFSNLLFLLLIALVMVIVKVLYTLIFPIETLTDLMLFVVLVLGIAVGAGRFFKK